MDHKTLLTLLCIVTLASVYVSASMIIPANEHAKAKSQAPDHSPVIGENWDLERVDFIHYAKPSGPQTKQPTCYKLMGVKWATDEVPYAINPDNSGLGDDAVMTAISASAGTWDAATTMKLFLNPSSPDYSATYGELDGTNAIAFGPYSDSRVIAVTSVWYTRAGRQIVEFDMLFNTKFAWGDAAVDPSLMDLQNIATHELGHSVGLSDIYSGSCTAVTMYGYSTEGDVGKRTLEQADITGLQKMYGA